MPRLLTVRKTAWANNFKPDIIRGIPLSPNAAVEARYADALERLIIQMAEDTERQLRKLYAGEAAEQFFAQDASVSDIARRLMDALQKKYDALFDTRALSLADSFALQSDKASSAALHSSIQKLSGGLSLPTTTLQGPIKEVLKATVAENVSLIKSIPQKYLNGVQGAVMRSITTGNGMQSLVPYLANSKGVTVRRARFIAMDQTRKAFNGLNKGRMLAVGIGEYEWLHTGGSNHPRKLHQEMSGNIYKFDAPPIIQYNPEVRGIPGQLPGCRCRMVPVIKFRK